MIPRLDYRQRLARAGKSTPAGHPIFLFRLNGIYASPVSAKGRVYVLGRNGACVVLKSGPKLEILATNLLSDSTDASIALVGSELFIRGHQHLYCIAAD